MTTDTEHYKANTKTKIKQKQAVRTDAYALYTANYKCGSGSIAADACADSF
jgi:hypothetical protein